MPMATRFIPSEPISDLPPFNTGEAQQWLEWAGSKMLSLSISSPYPKDPGVVWPEYANDAHTAYGYTGERLRAAQPNSREIDLMDAILELPQLVDRVDYRRILNARALVAPISHRYLYSWRRIAQVLGTSPRLIRSMHLKGLNEIVAKLPKRNVDAIRKSLSIYIT